MSNRPRRKKTEEDNQQLPPKGMLNNLEMFGIGVFCLVFLFYSLTKCMNDSTIETTLNDDKPEKLNTNDTPQLLTRRIDTSSFKKNLP